MEITLMDGGMGQELVNRSAQPPHPDWGDKVMRHEPHLVQALHQDYLRAGARVITLNTYVTTPRTCTDANGNRDRADYEEWAGRAIELAHAARKTVGVEADIAASLPPLNWSYRPDIVEAFETNLADYRQIVEFTAPHVDLFICETMSTAAEAKAAATAASGHGKPVWVSWTLADQPGADGVARLRSGETVGEAIAALDGLDVSAYLFNCCLPEAIDAGLPALAGQDRRFGGYANAFTPITSDFAPGETVDVLGKRHDLSPDDYAARALDWIAAGATIIGGCCETDPAHIAEISRKLAEAGHRTIGRAA